MAFTSKNLQQVEIPENLVPETQNFMGLCGGEDVSMFVEAAIEKIENHFCVALRRKEICFTVSTNKIHNVPVGKVEKLVSVRLISCGKCVWKTTSGCEKYVRKDGTLNLCLCPPCSDCAYFEVTYRTAPQECEFDAITNVAIMKIAKALYDCEDMPDLDKLLSGKFPSPMERFYKSVGGLSVAIA